jgi:hypothetical protein
MSDINLDFTVSNNSIDFTVQPNDITITPEEIQLTFNANFQPLAGGSNTQLQYNLNGTLDGIPNVTYNGSNISLGNVSTVKITGGVNGYVLQTDGAGNLDWTAQTGGGGNGSPGGSNTQIQYNDNGTFGGNVGFTFNEVSGNVAMPGSLAVTGNITGNVQTAYLANFATVANSVAGSNVSGQVSSALIAGTVYTGAQPNVTSLGTLTSLTVAGITTIQEAVEKFTPNATGATGTINYDLLNQAIVLQTANATSNFTLNFRGNSSTTLDSILQSNQSITCTFVNVNGANAYYANVIQIDGSTITPAWGSSVTGTNNAKDVYTFNILKTASNTYTVLGSVIGYY